ncbi:hypothetical protein NE865_08172 [Phthorimaea operculella]|nr:hypothetical protein NE865_08172 [Phthorimaea operculella]
MMAAVRVFFLVFLTVVSSVTANHGSDGADVGTEYKKEHCIRVTPEREAEIQEIMNKISDYVQDLAMDYQHFDIRLLKFAIERHTPHETEEDKDVQIQVTINDCEETFDVDDEEKSVSKTDANGPSEKPKANQNSNTNDVKTPLVQPEVVTLDLDRNGQELVKVLQKRRGKRPIVVYIQSGKEYYFLRR